MFSQSAQPYGLMIMQPRDLAVMVEMASDVRRAVTRSVDFLHLPVPKDRTDDAYFRPLKNLEGYGDAALYLGLVHYDDRKGDLARIDAARPFAPRFGVASECGWGAQILSGCRACSRVIASPRRH